MPSLDQLDIWLQGVGAWFLPVLALASFIEYVFPPFPGDSVTLVGTLAAVRGTVSPWAVLVATSIGSLAGSIADYVFGAWLQRRLASGKRLHGRFLTEERLRRVERSYRRWGLWLILANRFIPVARAVFFVFAGMSGLSLGRTVVVGLVGAIAWNAALVAAGFAVGANLEALHAFARRMGTAGLVTAVVVTLLALGVFFWRKRRRRSAVDVDDAKGEQSDE